MLRHFQHPDTFVQRHHLPDQGHRLFIDGRNW